MDIYLHDRSAAFQFVLRGKLVGDWVQRLEHAWRTAMSVLQGKEVVVDLTGITDADPKGFDLLVRMRAAGARLTASQPARSNAILTRLGISLPRANRSRLGWRALRFLRLA